VHAFENTTQNFFQATLLEKGGDKGTVQCSACFTIRRDVSVFLYRESAARRMGGRRW